MGIVTSKYSFKNEIKNDECTGCEGHGFVSDCCQATATVIPNLIGIYECNACKGECELEYCSGCRGEGYTQNEPENWYGDR